MSDTVICMSEMHMLPSEGNIMTFEYYHPECFTFPTRYIEALARHDMALYVEWPYEVRAEYPYGHRSEKTIHFVPLNRMSKSPPWGRVACSSCEEFLHPVTAREDTDVHSMQNP